MSTLLPIAGKAEMRRQAAELAGRHRRAMLGVLVLHGFAAATGLVGPPLLGSLVQGLQTGIDTVRIDRVVLILAVFLVAQTVLTFFARRASFVLSEQMFAELREDFMRRVLSLPLSTVERAGIGDLVSRTTADVDALARTIRFAIPETSIACVTALLVVAAALWVSPIAALPCIVGVPILLVGTRWYLRYAPGGYLWERAAYASLAGTTAETVDGGRTVEALGLSGERARRIDANLADAYRSERFTLRLRTIWFPTVDVAYVLPVVAALRGAAGSSRPTTPRSARSRRSCSIFSSSPIRSTGCSRGLTRSRWAGRRSRGSSASPLSLPIDRRRERSPATSGCAPTTCAMRTFPVATCCTGSSSTSSPANGSPWWARPARANRRSVACSPASTLLARAPSRSVACRSSISSSRLSAGRLRS